MLFLIIEFYNHSGEIYYGFFTGKDTLYNSDAYISLIIDFRIKREIYFYLKYSSLLEMAEQQGRVFLDPMFATYSIVFGIKFKKYLWFDFFMDHYCRHYIDKELEEGKVVFNGEFYSIRNYFRKYDRYDKRYTFNFTYAFYPHAIIVDWLNSRPFYRHRFILDTYYKAHKFVLFGNKMEYAISRADENYPKRGFYRIVPEISLFYRNERGVFNLFIDYYFKIKDPFRSPEDLLFIGISYNF
uniref:DUF2490 domain-containing protein n=1 Tax=candidate division WOR-3 bacterium TaxID=2052148 RepID=A0A7C4Y455_UNCW3